MGYKLTMKDKKEEILKAYEQLLNRSKEKEKTADKEVKPEQVTEDIVVRKASAYTAEGIVKGFADLRLDLSKTLTDLSDKLIAETDKLDELQQAITIETGRLETLYNIKATAETLATYMQTADEKKRAFEEEIAHIREDWKDEQEEHDLAVKERDAYLKKERERETEEYAYSLTLSRKKDRDAYEEEKSALKKALREEKEVKEKELAERESLVSAQESEIAELRARVESFPEELAKAREKAEKDASMRVEKEAKQRAELLAKEIEGDKRVAELRIKTLESTVASQSTRIESLTKELNSATAQVQDIAVKSIEGASGIKALSAVNKIALEQAKNVSTAK